MAAKLCKKYPDMAGDITEKQNEALDNWEKLEELSDQRKRKLADSFQLQKFLADARELVGSLVICDMGTGFVKKNGTG